MNRKAVLSNSKGQFVIEAILLMTLLVGVVTVLTTQIKERGILNEMISGPWAKISGMAEFGVWAEPDARTKKLHPNTFTRIMTPKED